MSFHIGQKVVCVYDGKRSDPDGEYPEYRGVYTVRELVTHHVDGHLMLYLQEIRNPVVRVESGLWAEQAYGAKYFRPVRTTDISIFKAMLVTPPKQRVSA